MSTPRRPNAPPSDEEFRRFSDVLLSGSKLLCELDERMEMLRSELLQCGITMREAQEGMAAAKVVMNPVHCLPNETLEEIFLACLEVPFPPTAGRWRCSHHNSLDPSMPPWTLSQVSSRWRNIAENLPSLWSRVGVCLGPNAVGNIEHRIYLLSTQLYRSSAALLDLSLCLTDSLSALQTSPVLCSVVTTSRRWRSLSVCLGSNTMQSLSIIKGRLPSLRVLGITDYCLRSTFNASSTISVDLFQAAPELHSVKLDISRSIATVILPQRQIRSLSSNVRNYADFSSLESCTLFIGANYDLRNSRPLQHSQVRHLTLCGGVPLVKPLMRCIASLPLLSSLSIESDVNPTDVLTFIRNSTIRLTKLSITATSANADGLVGLLASDDLVPLEALKIERRFKFPKKRSSDTPEDEPDVLLSRLSTRLLTSAQPFLPSLTSLTIKRPNLLPDIPAIYAVRPSLNISIVN